MFKSGWILFPAAFFLLANYAVSDRGYFYFLRLIYFCFLFALFFFCRCFNLRRLLAPVSGAIALLVFSYGIFQKFYLFPWLLTQTGSGPSFFAQAQKLRIASGRVFAIFSLPTLYAMVCGLLLIFIVHYFFKARAWQRIFWFFLLLLGLGNLFLTQSFGGIIFFAAAVLFYLFVSGVIKRKFLAPLVMVLALFFFLVVALRFSEARELQPAKLRMANWLQAGRVIASAPLLGRGLGSYEIAVPAHVAANEPASIFAHNFFLQLAAEIGLPALLLLFMLAVVQLKKNYRNFLLPQNALFSAAAILILLFNVFDVGNYFFAAGVAFAIVLSQLAAGEKGTWRLPLAALVLLALPLLANEISADRQKEGDVCFSRAEAARAEFHYRQALRFNPFSYRSLLGRAVIAQDKGEPSEAERLFSKVLAIYPEQPYANYALSRLAHQRGEYLSALLHARQAAANKKNMEYQRWHEFIKATFKDRLALPGD